jgi:glutamate dehydrogenase (NAD(P)+)
MNPMNELDTPMFRLAVAQFDQAAELMDLDPNLRERLKLPDRSLIVSVPIRMDNGTVKVFTGYRVQHDSARGPRRAAFDIIRTSTSVKWRRWPCG